MLEQLKAQTGPHGGNLYTSPAGTFEVYGDILKRYLAYGGPEGGLGYPITDETGCPDGIGRYNHFERGSIYWSPTTGAHIVYGAIRDRWAAMGWEKSYLGYPLSDEQPFDEGGRATQFQGGQIYWWPDTGAIDLNQVVVHYTGLICFGETDWDQGSDSDEPYAIFGVLSPTGTRTVATRVYEDVDGGESRPDLIELYRGKPAGLVISSTIMENDFGDPNKYRDKVEAGVVAAGQVVAGAVTAVPAIGPILAAGVEWGLMEVKDSIVGAVNGVLDTGDDLIGRDATTFTAKQMVLLAARTPNSVSKGVGFKAETRLISGQGASYKAYFGLVVA